MTLARADIERCVPHVGAMCLLDAVTHWDAMHIVCRADAPTATHPLMREGRVPTVAAIEYAAQATAVHGALLGNTMARRTGLLAKLSDVKLHGPCIPEDFGPLTVRAELQSRAASGCLYAFGVVCGTQPIASGCLMVAFIEAAAP